MASGRPDYTSQSLIKGSDAGTHRTVAVDPAGNLLTLIKGQFGGAPVTIAVDAAGNILGVLQGDYAGSLKTLAVDAKGRMLAVLTDPEDVFGNPHYMGSAELAARLGFKSLDRLGQVLYNDPGGTNLGTYTAQTTGDSSLITESAKDAPLGGLCYKLVSGDTVLPGTAKLFKYLPYLGGGGGIGVELLATIAPTLDYLEIELNPYTGSHWRAGEIKLDILNHKIYLHVFGGAWEEIGIMPETSGTYPLLIKFTHDPATGKGKLLRIGSQTWDLSSYALHGAASVAAAGLYLQLFYASPAAVTCTNYLGPIIVTVNEL